MKEHNKRGRIKYIIIWPCLLLCLFLCANRQCSKYTCKTERNSFSFGCERFNDTRVESFFLEKGDSVAVDIVRVKGRFDITIGEFGKKPIYTGNDVQTGSFEVIIPEDGTYIITVAGKKGEGSLSFQMQTENEQAMKSGGEYELKIS